MPFTLGILMSEKMTCRRPLSLSSASVPSAASTTLSISSEEAWRKLRLTIFPHHRGVVNNQYVESH